MKMLQIMALLAAAGLLLWGCGGGAGGEDNANPPDPIVTVQVTPIVKQTLPVTLAVDGTVDVRDRQSIVSPIDGTLVSISAEVDALVRAGDTLAIICTRESEASLAGARRLLEQATTPQQKDDARQALQIAEASEQLVPVIAGRNGVVVERMASAGQFVQVNSELLQLVDLSTIDFVANVPLQDVSRVQVGQACSVSFPALPSHTLAGTVAAVSARSDQGSQTTPVRIEFTPRAHGITSLLRVGMMGTAAITTELHSGVLVVPKSALLRNDLTGSYTIYTVGADSLARAVPVTVGFVSDSLAEVDAPSLHAGDFAITRGNYEVSDSTRVTIETGTAQ